MQVLKNTFAKLIQTPLIGDEERQSLTESFNRLTNEDAMLKMCKQIEYNYCTDEFLESIKNDKRILVTYQTKGGKYRKELFTTDNKSYSIRDYRNNDSTGTNNLGIVSEADALKKIEKEVKLSAYYDDINYYKI